jgi:hypothetical protein
MPPSDALELNRKKPPGRDAGRLLAAAGPALLSSAASVGNADAAWLTQLTSGFKVADFDVLVIGFGPQFLLKCIRQNPCPRCYLPT